MITVTFDGQAHSLPESEPVLDGLLRAGVDIPWSCRAGACQSCLVQTADGSPAPDPSWTAGLKDSLKATGYLLACQCKPTADLALRSLSLDDSTMPAVILAKTPLNDSVLGLHLRPERPFVVRPGQYVTLFGPDQVSRSYSVANLVADDGHLELHIRRIEGGRMSNWLHDVAEPGDRLALRGPAGSCFYVQDDAQDFDMLLAGTGTGLAPLYGIVQDALKAGHRGQIHLIHGALRPGDLYLTDILRDLAATNDNFIYTPCVLEGGGGDLVTGSLDAVTLGQLHTPAATRAYFCGAPEMVTLLRKKAFLSGVASRHIYCDAFLPTRA
ncbi:2Fe-2S iron-sulfur cluster-binding protein [Govanella unica]|uniref:FAD-binding oxidoreductase n=1 Tax=Govanella unica TaxID=2975056 RepID=A0A9X3Z638_9PROT|nr:2Fe-2S iron-sulfur cluster-binding protein [Govania unica]MDA5192544.1 FAD-binding oxidoreductase [Govania unica]